MNINADQSSYSVARNALNPLGSVTITKLPLRTGSTLSRYLLTNEHGLELGLIEKFKNDKTTIHPWKAFVGIGAACRFVGAFYDEDGGKEAAIKAVLKG